MMDLVSFLTKHKKKITQWGIPLLVSSIVGVVCCDHINNYYNQNELRYLVAKRDLVAGQRLNVLDFDLSARCPKKVVCIADQQLESVLNKTLQLPLSTGAPLTSRHLKQYRGGMSQHLKKGFLAYSICLDTVVPLQIGDHIDVLALSHGQAIPVVQSARVLGLGRCDGGKALVLALRPRLIAGVEKARQQGKLKVALRNPSDSTRRRRRKPKRRRKRKSVVIISG